ncbi:MAG: preprotein translocase subunit SecG [Vicingaceae bacterium]
MVFISILVIIICVLLVLVVLIQNPKGGLDSAFSTNNQVMGVRKTTDFLEKATWTLGVLLVVASIASATLTSRTSVATDDEGGEQSKMMEQIDETTLPSAPVSNGVPLPANDGSASSGEQPTKETE